MAVQLSLLLEDVDDFVLEVPDQDLTHRVLLLSNKIALASASSNRLPSLPGGNRMTKVTVELLDAIQGAFNARDVDAILSYFADDVEWLIARGQDRKSTRQN